jgi:hypothetical protein
MNTGGRFRGIVAVGLFLLTTPSTAHAKYAGGSGTAQDPYQIATAADLIALGETPADYDKHFILTTDIDLDPNLPGRKVFDKAVIAPDTDPVGWYFQGTAFTGVFDGNHHSISHVVVAGASYVGLFGQLRSGAEVRDLGVVEVHVVGSGGSVGGLAGANGEEESARGGNLTDCYSTGLVHGGNSFVGGLVGDNAGPVTRCHSSAAVSGDWYVGGLVGDNCDGIITASYSTGVVSGDSYVGGLVGLHHAEDMAVLTDCFSTGTVQGNSRVGGLIGGNGLGPRESVGTFAGDVIQCYSSGVVSGADCVGGLLGLNEGAVTQCYSTGAVSGDTYVGGLVGSNYYEVTGCYSAGAVSGKSRVGGLVGCNWYGNVSHCYSASVVIGTAFVGGLLGENMIGEVTGCFWDIETSGQTKSAGGTGKTTAEMQLAATFPGWGACGHEGTWTVDDGRDYPRLCWENKPGTTIEGNLSDLLPGDGTEANPYLIYTAQDIDAIAGFSCEQEAHFWLAFVPGEGTQDKPYLISTAEQLAMIGTVQGREWDKHFTLTADIDLDPGLPGGKVFDQAVIAPATTAWGGAGIQVVGISFTGVFDGKGHTISHLTIIGQDNLGLFGYVASGAEIRDLGVVDVNITGSGYFIGGLVGANGTWDGGGGSVTGCYTGGAVRGTSWVGGLAGLNSGYVTQCHSTAVVTGTRYIGGLLGHNEEYGIVAQSYSSGTAISTAGTEVYDTIGGLVGDNRGSVTQCYSVSAVDGRVDVGGLVGNNGGTVDHCYSKGPAAGEFSVGGLVGYNYGTVTECYSAAGVRGTYIGGLVTGQGGSVFNSVWDVDTSGVAGSAGGVGLTTAEMMDPYLLGLNGFANDPNWVLDAGRDYPRLAWEGTPGQIIPEPAIDWLEGQGTVDSPYRIDTAEQLILLGRAGILCDRHFVLGADLDLDPALPGRQVFGQALIPALTGVFDGGGHTISHLTIAGTGRVGLFGHLASGAEVKDLGVVDVNMTSRGSAGGLVCSSEGTVTDCYSTGTVSGGSAGGLVGQTGKYNKPPAIVTRCYSTALVAGGGEVGGLVGGNWYSYVTQSYSTGSVSGTGWYVGGLVGRNQDASVVDCYSMGAVSGGSYVGGLVGVCFYPSGVDKCYSTGTVSGEEGVGGLIGKNERGTGYFCFWDVETSGQATSAGGMGKTTAEMQTSNTFLPAYWDFAGETKNGTKDIWWIDEGKDYPRLWWEAAKN